MSGPAILYVHDLRGSGVVTNAMALARRLGEKRDTILCAGYGTGLNRNADVGAAELVILSERPEGRRPRVEAARRLRRLIRDRGPALVMSAGNFGHTTVFAASRGLQLQTVYRVSNEIFRPNASLRTWRRRTWLRILIASASRVILVGRALAELPDFAGALRDGKALYIPNGVDLDRARRGSGEPPPHPWLSDNGIPVVLTIGRIHPQKNLEGLIHGAALAARRKALRLAIVGSGDPELVERLKRRAAEQGLPLLFAGETSNVFAWLKHARLFALVSNWEGSSTALLEALAVGTPVVASTQAGDAAYVLDDGRYGVLVDADDAESIAAGILAQLDNPVLPGSRAEDYDLASTHARYLEVLEAL